jgi:prepilin-type N-terminal cleavage/methylation domain-containing protein
MRMHSTQFRGTKGLTLIEVITTIAILGSFMTLLSFHMVGMTRIWLNGANDDFFDQHVDGVSLFLNQLLASSVPLQDSNATGPVSWERPPGWSDMDAPLLHFRSPEAPALFSREGERLPAILGFLVHDRRDGLAVVWYSELEPEEVTATNDLLRTTISTFVNQLEYAYYDRERERWELTDRPQETDDRDGFILPHFIRLTFSHPDHGERQRSILIPQQAADVPMF